MNQFPQQLRLIADQGLSRSHAVQKAKACEHEAQGSGKHAREGAGGHRDYKAPGEVGWMVRIFTSSSDERARKGLFSHSKPTKFQEGDCEFSPPAAGSPPACDGARTGGYRLHAGLRKKVCERIARSPRARQRAFRRRKNETRSSSWQCSNRKLAVWMKPTAVSISTPHGCRPRRHSMPPGSRDLVITQPAPAR